MAIEWLSKLICATILANVYSQQYLASNQTENAEDEIPIGENCTAGLRLNWCFIDLVSRPEGCLTFGRALEAVVPQSSGLGDLLESGGKYSPSNWDIGHVYVDRCSDSFQIETTVPGNFSFLPGYLNLIRPSLRFAYYFSLHDYDVTFASVLTLGRKRFRVKVTKSSHIIDMEGKAIAQSIPISKLISDMTSPLIPGNGLRSHIEKLGIQRYVITNVAVRVRVTDAGFGISLEFIARQTPRNNDTHFMITINKNSLGSDLGLGMAITGEFKNIRPLDKISDMVGVDLSFIPLLGNLTVPSLVVTASSRDIFNPINPIRSVNSVPISSVINKGLTLLFSLGRANSNKTFTAELILSPGRVDFTILEGTEINISDIIGEILNSLHIPLPPQWRPENFLALKVDGFSYNIQTKTLHLQIKQTRKIDLMEGDITLIETTLVLNIFLSGQEGSRYSVDLKSIWEIQDVDIRFWISKPPGRSPWMAECRPDVDIPIGSLLEKFAVSLYPAGSLGKGAQHIGLDSFHIVDPYVQVFIGNSSEAAKFSGTASFGVRKGVTMEIFFVKIKGVTAVALGLVFDHVPLISFIKDLTDDVIDLSVLPGSAIIDQTTIGLIYASNTIPQGTTMTNFENESLSGLRIVQGLSLVASFSIPHNCESDTFCKVLQKCIGTGTAIVVRGTFDLPNVRLSATIPRNISIIHGLVITNVGFEIEVGKREAFGLTGKMLLSQPRSFFPNDVILFGEIGLSDSGAFLQMSMRGFWNNVFGFSFLAIGNLHLRVGIVPDPIPISLLEMGGQAYIGYRDVANAKPIFVSLYIGVDTVSPAQSFFMGSINKLTIPAIVQAFKPEIQLPKILDDLGFPEGLNCSLSLQSRILRNGIVIPRGLYFRGLLSIFVFKVWTEARISTNGIYLNVTIYPIKIAGGLLSLQGVRPGTGPGVLIDLSWNPPQALVEIQGSVTVLFLTVSVKILIDKDGMCFHMSGKLLHRFEASLNLCAGNQKLEMAEFEVEGRFKESFHADIEAQVHQLLDNFIRLGEEALSNAEKRIDDEIAKLNKAYEDLEKKKKEIKDKERELSTASRAHSDASRKHEHAAHANRSTSAAISHARDLSNRHKSALNSARGRTRGAQARFDEKRRQSDRDIRLLEDNIRRTQQTLDSLKQQLEDTSRSEQNCPSGCRKKRNVVERTDVSLADEAGRYHKRTKRWVWIIVSAVCGSREEKRHECLNGIHRKMDVLSSMIDHNLHILELKRKELSDIRASLDSTKRALQNAQAAEDQARRASDEADRVLRDAEERGGLSKRHLDAAKSDLTAAEAMVEQSRRRLEAAKRELLSVSHTVNESHTDVNDARLSLDGIKKTHGFGLALAEQAATGVPQVDIKECSFRLPLETVQTGVLHTKVTASFYGQEDKTFSTRLNLHSPSDFVHLLVGRARDELNY